MEDDDISRQMACMEEMRNAYKILVRKDERNRPYEKT
jgi:hypothetical protein